MQQALQHSGLVPRGFVVESAYYQGDKAINYETGEDFAGLDASAMWEDFKVGVEHLTCWEKVEKRLRA